MSALSTAAMARAAEQQGDKQHRNKLANALFKAASRRKVSRAGITVETWWDKRSKNWITDVTGRNADFSGNILDAAVAHLWALYAILDQCEPNHPFKPKANQNT